ncbi:hypothetical protein [Marinomonas sp. THO17]|uniref:hypothetical protein n=1 Tax=Marinomonas sp. THO17 TaxID=3149048 RepID=UPI00336BF55A
MLGVKTGNATESSNQSKIFDACQLGQGVGCGGNADDAGYKNSQAPTQIYTIQPKE